MRWLFFESPSLQYYFTKKKQLYRAAVLFLFVKQLLLFFCPLIHMCSFFFYTVYVQHSIQMIIFMLKNNSRKTFYQLFLTSTFLIDITDFDYETSQDLAITVGYGQTSFSTFSENFRIPGNLWIYK